MARATIFVCLWVAQIARTTSEDVLSKVVSTAGATLANSAASKVVADAGNAVANSDVGKIVANAENVAVQSVATNVAASGAQANSAPAPMVVEATPSNEKTTQAVLKAVTTAEEKSSTAEDKKASAVVDATVNVLKTESSVEKAVAPQVLAKAKEDAKETFEQLDEAKIGTKAAADAAAKVALAEIDGASGEAVSKDVQVNAEKAAVAAGKGVADHPSDLAGAVSEAISTVKKEENSTGAVSVNKTETGLVAGAVASTQKVVSEVTADVTAQATAVVQQQSGSVLFPLLLALGLVAYWWMNNIHAQQKVSPYMGALMTMRKEEEKGSSGEAFERKECEFTEYRQFP